MRPLSSTSSPSLTSSSSRSLTIRREEEPERLEELAESIRAQGLIQPIIVRGIGAGRYEIIAGERRWRASQRAGLREVPAVVREVDDRRIGSGAVGPLTRMVQERYLRATRGEEPKYKEWLTCF